MAVALTATPASAVDDQAEANDIAAVVAEAAPSADRVAIPDSTARHGVAFNLGESTVSIPTDANDGVRIESPGTTISISLPSELSVKNGVLASDGTMVYSESGDDAHAAVQALDDGSVRLQTILESPDAPSTYTYDFGGEVDLVLLEDGSVEVIETIADGVVATLGLIDTPWAVDARGADVPTHYTVDGSTLTQHVEHSAKHSYPITADPSYGQGRHGWLPVYYVHFSKSETRSAKAFLNDPVSSAGPLFLSLIHI